jgi:hypothetical protein
MGMINLNLNGIKGSEILRIQAAVLDAMERANFHPEQISTELSAGKNEDEWLMVFAKETAALTDLQKVIQELGGSFNFDILSNGKKTLFLRLVGKIDDYKRLLQKSQQVNSVRPLYSGTSGTSIQPR